MNKYSQLLLPVILCGYLLFVPQQSSAQLDSTYIAVSLGADTINSTDTVTIILTFDEISDVGFVSIVVYDIVSEVIVFEVAKSREEWELENYLLPDSLTCPLFVARDDQSYLIEVTPKNLSGAYTGITTYTLVN